MAMFVQRWHVGLTLSHLTFASEGLRGRMVLSMVGEGDCWGVKIWGIDWNMARERDCGVCVCVEWWWLGRTWGAERVS
jgi:hypothetical protein